MAGTTQLEKAYDWERTQRDRLWLTQPMGKGDLRELTWGQALGEVRRMAAHLRSLDLPERSQICIFSKNSAWWLLSDLAIWMSGHVSVPLYPNLTAETIRQILEHSETKLIFIGKLDGYAAMAPGIPDELTRIALPLAPEGVRPTWESIIADREPLKEDVKREPSELATIVYTSGSTGVPKGVMLSFEAMMTAGLGVTEMIDANAQDRILSYLPLAHVFERWLVENGTLIAGYQVFFAESLDTFIKDLQRARPTLFISVPRLWQKFQAGVFAKMPEEKLARLLKIPIVKSFVRKKVLGNLGLDSVRFAGCGSAPISAELISWYRALGLELLEGYGMSENFAYSHISRPGEVRPGYVGRPMPGVEQKISEAGELLVKSPADMMGYFKAPELTETCYTEEGFLMTGDRGEVDEEGRLKITGRVKEIFKTSKGKYVSPAPIETKLQDIEPVDAACVFGSGYPQPFAVVTLAEELRAVCDKPDARQDLCRALEVALLALNGELSHHENLAFLAISSEVWTPENGLLTPTLKLKRHVIEEKYKELMDGWYERREKLIWI